MILPPEPTQRISRCCHTNTGQRLIPTVRAKDLILVLVVDVVVEIGHVHLVIDAQAVAITLEGHASP